MQTPYFDVQHGANTPVISKHVVFGRLVDGLPLLSRLESLPTDPSDKRTRIMPAFLLLAVDFVWLLQRFSPSSSCTAVRCSSSLQRASLALAPCQGAVARRIVAVIATVIAVAASQRASGSAGGAGRRRRRKKSGPRRRRRRRKRRRSERRRKSGREGRQTS